MPTAEEIQLNKEKLYESSSLTDDLNDAEAQVLLKWGQGQIDRLATSYPEEFEQKARFLRQLMKNMNRFVGQREFNDSTGQEKYMQKVVQYVEPLGWQGMTSATFFTALPDDAADMAGTLDAMLHVLNEGITEPDSFPLADPTAIGNPQVMDEENSVTLRNPQGKANEADIEGSLLENPNVRSINQDSTFDSGDKNSYGEEEEQ